MLATDQSLHEGRIEAEQQLERLRELCERPGGGSALMKALYLCAVHRLALPEWLCIHFARRAALVHNASLGSWDDAFGKPWPHRTEQALHKERERIAMRTKVYFHIWDLVMRDKRSITPELFAEIAPAYGVSGSTLERRYYEEVEGGRPSVAEIRKSMSA